MKIVYNFYLRILKLHDNIGWYTQKGTAEAKGEKKLIAFRADIDALQMTEDNPHLEY